MQACTIGCTIANQKQKVKNTITKIQKIQKCKKGDEQMQVCTIGCTMGNQKQKGQSDGSDSDWTLRHTNLPCFPHFFDPRGFQTFE